MDFLDYAGLTIPILLIPSTAFVFSSITKQLGQEKGYLLGFLYYWIIWCLLVPLVLLGVQGFIALFVDITPLLSRPNWLVSVLWAFITLVTILMYGRDFLHASPTLVLIAIPAATVNGICEELLWRGFYVKAFQITSGWGSFSLQLDLPYGTWYRHLSFQKRTNGTSSSLHSFLDWLTAS